ncbi:uncharacterized protein LOC123636551 isoform X2 [Lemur catta]|uniref:uncharacterized protein LOC123636551 isoform X2 n=1 Tax=Lemur catta TaxID=9447 RepID=UPI001E2693AC|nr:uncharacterized protein LOC123636551 isoform X2 [Lemur catta]
MTRQGRLVRPGDGGVPRIGRGLALHRPWVRPSPGDSAPPAIALGLRAKWRTCLWRPCAWQDVTGPSEAACPAHSGQKEKEEREGAPAPPGLHGAHRCPGTRDAQEHQLTSLGSHRDGTEQQESVKTCLQVALRPQVPHSEPHKGSRGHRMLTGEGVRGAGVQQAIPPVRTSTDASGTRGQHGPHSGRASASSQPLRGRFCSSRPD